MVIRVDKLPHIEYIETLSLYFSGLIKLYTDDESVSEKMKDICNKKIEKAKPIVTTVVQHVDQVEEQKVKPKAFNIFDFVPVQKQPSNVEEENDTSPKPGSPKPRSPKPKEDLILEDDSSIGSDEEFFGIGQLGGGPKAKAKAKSSDEEDTSQNNNYFLEHYKSATQHCF